MATGDVADCTARIAATLPPWVPTSLPIINAVLTGLGKGFSHVYHLISFVRTQSRIATATGGFLDIIAADFFGTNMLRRAAEPDSVYQARLLKELLRPRVTLAAIKQMLIDLTGRTPSIIVPGNPGNIGGLDIGTLALDTDGCSIFAGVNNQIFITAFRPIGNGVPLVSGLDSFPSGLDVGNISLVDLSQITGPLTDAEITAQILRTVAAGIDAEISISS